MSTKTTFSIFQSKLTAELRWFTFAAAMVLRPDRKRTLLARAREMPARLTALNETYAAGLAFINDTDTNVSEEQTLHFESDFAQIYELAGTIDEAAIKLDKEGSESTGGNSGSLMSRLPTLDLPRFDGQLDRWLGFFGLFESLVDSRADLSAAQKMAYLLASLQEEALGLVQHLAIDDSSYETAKVILKRRYNDVRRLADAHVGQILNLPKVSRVSALRSEIVNPVLVAVNALRQLNLPVDQWSFLLLHLVLAKLPSEMRLRFERVYGGDSSTHLPLYSDLQKFLEDECRRVDTAGGLAPSESYPKSRRERPLAQPQVTRPPRPIYGATQEEQVACQFCKRSGHRMPICPKFVALRLSLRRRIARERRLCYYCLERHFQRECPQPRPCGQCGGAHHLTLCANRNQEFQGGSESDSDVSNNGRRSPARAGGHSPKRTSRSRAQDRALTGGGRRPTPPKGGDFGLADNSTAHRNRRVSPPCSPRLEQPPPHLRRDAAGPGPSAYVMPGRRDCECYRPRPHSRRGFSPPGSPQ